MDEHAGAAALTLLESVLIHLKEIGVLDEDDRDMVYEIAISAHRDAAKLDDSAEHTSVSKLLHTMQIRADGVAARGGMRPKVGSGGG